MQRRLLLVNIVAMVSTIICSIISAGCLSLAAYIGSENKKYKKLQQKQEDEHIGEIVSEQIKPIRDELKKLRDELFEVAAEEGDTRDELMSSWRFRLMQLCRQYIARGYMLYAEYDQLAEIYRHYTHFGGNGQGESFFNRASALPQYHTHEEAHTALDAKN